MKKNTKKYLKIAKYYVRLYLVVGHAPTHMDEKMERLM